MGIHKGVPNPYLLMLIHNVNPKALKGEEFTQNSLTLDIIFINRLGLELLRPLIIGG